MSLELFDCNLFLGLPARGCYKPAGSASELMEMVGKSGIKRGLAWHIAQLDSAPQVGNKLISDAIKGRDDLYGCWTILPPITGEVITPDFFSRMKQNRITALRVFPDKHLFMLNRVTFGDFFDELVEHRIPLLLSIEGRTPWRDVYALLGEVPNLTCVLCDIGVWGADRFTWPLLDTYPNVYIETSELSIEAGGVEAGVAKFGAERFLFGSGFPLRYPEGAALQLIHSEISDEDKQKIASGNLDRLISEVKL